MCTFENSTKCMKISLEFDSFQNSLKVLIQPAGAAPARKKWGGKGIELMARRYT